MQERDVEFDVVHYLKDHLSRDDLADLLAMLPNEPTELVRRDKHFADLGLSEEDVRSVEQVTEVLSTHPRLMQRPVVVRGERAVISRPPKTVLQLL